MSDFTIGNETINVRYEVDEREIYNDIRSKVGIMISETKVDPDDPFYNWQWSTGWVTVLPGETVRFTYGAKYVSASDWEIVSHYAAYNTYDWSQSPPYQEHAYYDYSIVLETVDGERGKDVVIVNTGIEIMILKFEVKYKYLAAERVTHEDETLLLVTVRATDETSIMKYGRRVMNLTWSEGSDKTNMQSLVDYYLVRYKEPVARLKATIMGKTDTLRTQIITREISDVITADFNDLGFNADCYINSISIKDTPAGIPLCTWGLEEQRTEEALSIFTLGTNALDGAAVLGS